VETTNKSADLVKITVAYVVALYIGGVAEDCEEGINANIIPMNGDYNELKNHLNEILDRGKSLKVENSSVNPIIA
jgi:hypothetical protein